MNMMMYVSYVLWTCIGNDPVQAYVIKRDNLFNEEEYDYLLELGDDMIVTYSCCKK